MNEDHDRTRLGNGPHNLAILRHMALNAIQKEGSKGSLHGKFKRAGWNDDFLKKTPGVILKCDCPALLPHHLTECA
jgi:hypothetical protein